MDDLELLREFHADVPVADEVVRARTMAALRAAIDSERTTAARAGSTPPRLSRRFAMIRPRLRIAAVAAAFAAAAVALLLVAPWQGRGGLVDKALAAVGQGPVLHVVTEGPPPSFYRPVSLTTGEPIPTTRRQEVWFDAGRDLKKTIATVNGMLFDELLETPDGGFTPSGRVFTCAWIAAHPLEATKARVSCNANMQNGTTPKHIPEQGPTLDLALAGFVDHYQSALASGQAHEIGKGELDGRQVIWLRITTAQSANNGVSFTEDVAIDADSYVPLLVRTSGIPGVEFRVTAIDTEPYDPALFTKPAVAHGPTGGEVSSSSAIDPAEAASVLGGRALWLGQDWQGLLLVSTKRQELTTGYGSLSGLKPTRSLGVVFEYTRVNADGTTDTHPTLTIRESTQCEPAYFWMFCDERAASGDTMLVGLPFFSSTFQRDGLYISIGQAALPPTPVEIAHALQQVPGSKPN